MRNVKAGGRAGLRRGRLLLAMVCTALAIGCSAEDELASGDPWLEAGRGVDSYAALADGDRVQLMMGSQGGWHIDLAARVGNVSADDMTLRFALRDEASDEQIAYPNNAFLPRDEMTELPDGSLSHSGHRLVMLGTPGDVLDRYAHVDVQAIVDGLVLDAEARVLIVDELP